MWVTSVIVLITIFMRDLNLIAPVITICFLTTYGTLNLIVLIEQQLGLLSFRPTLQLYLGAFNRFYRLCLIALIVNPTISILILAILALGYLRLSHRAQEFEQQDVRTNLFLVLARWAAQKHAKQGFRR